MKDDIIMMAYSKKKWLKNNKKEFKSLDQAIENIDKRKLVENLDRVFSRYIKLRDSDENGYCRCITCGRISPWNNMTAGHYVLRDRSATRFHEQNVNTQCVRCNCYRAGEQRLHGEAIDRKYGKGTADYLDNLGRARGSKIDTLWLETKLKEYKKKVKILQNSTGGKSDKSNDNRNAIRAATRNRLRLNAGNPGADNIRR